MSKGEHKAERPKDLTVRRGLALVVCAILIPVAFNRMDDAYVVPQRLKQIIRVLDVETSVDSDWWRARVRVMHQGFQPYDVNLTLKWLEEDGDEVGRSQSIRAMSPGDTIIVRLSMKGIEGKKPVRHELDYTVEPVR